MKYKLINKQTKTETLCDKVTIDGYEYYVSDELIKIGDINIPSDFSRITDLSMTSSSDLPIVNEKTNGYKKIIATTNPNIDIPKVVDEVEELSEKFIGCKYEDIEDSIDQIGYDSFKRGYNKSQETHPFSENDVKEIFKIAQMQKNYGDYKPYTFEESIQLWKEQQPKIVYYEN